MVVVKTLEDNNKIEQAKTLKIPVLTFDQFKQTYQLS